MDAMHNDTAPGIGLWGILKKIVTINGFFGDGFFKDFKEGWQEAVARQEAARQTQTPDFDDDDDDDETVYTSFDYSPHWRPHGHWRSYDPGSDYNPHDAEVVANPYINPDSNLW